MTALTKGERNALDALHDFVESNGYPPTVRELALALNLRGYSTAHHYLQRLTEKGYLWRDPTKPRAMRILSEVQS